MALPNLIASTDLGHSTDTDGTVLTYDISPLSPADGDLVVIFSHMFNQGGVVPTLTAPALYSTVDSITGSAGAQVAAAYVHSHVWRTGDPTSLSFTTHVTGGGASVNFSTRYAVLLRPSIGTIPVGVDGAPAHSKVSLAPSIASSSLTPTRPNDLYFVLYGVNETHDAPWTGPPTLTSLFVTGTSPGVITAQLAYGTFSATTGTYAAGFGFSPGQIIQISVLFNVPPASGSGAGGGLIDAD